MGVGMSGRSEIMFNAQTSAVAGYLVGPFVASVSQKTLQALAVDNALVNSFTAPGWIMVVVYLGLMLKIGFFFQEPSTYWQVAATTAQPKTSQDRLGARRLISVTICLYIMIASNVGQSLIEVYIPKLAKNFWGWSLDEASMYLTGIMALLVPICLTTGRLTRILSDRNGLMLGNFIGIAFSVAILNYQFPNALSRVCTQSVGLVLVLSASSIVKPFVFSMNSKLVPPHLKSRTNTLTAACLCLGRAIGSFLGAIVEPNNSGFVQMSIFASCAILVGLSFKYLKPHTSAQ